MATMYETIMDLPLFKGVGKDQVSLFLEKTPLTFTNYSDGEEISTAGEEVKVIKFIISGEVCIRHELESVGLAVEEISGSGRVLGADRLFGISTGYPFRIVAHGRASIMEFKKEQYVNLLYTDRIYMLNFFNYLSLRAQRPVEVMGRFAEGDIGGRLRQMVAIMTDPVARRITIAGTMREAARYCGVSEEALDHWLKREAGAGLIEREPGRITVRNREEFLDAN